jgi:acetolactate synthase I/III small subunit
MTKIKIYTIIIFTENKPGVLYRIADLFLRRKINIESLTVSEIESKGLSRFTVVVKADPHIIEKVVKQLYRIIEVVKVFEKTDEELIFREIALLKVSTKNAEQREAVEKTALLCQAKVILVGNDFLMLEKSGTEEEITTLYTLVKPFGIKEYVRSGRVALSKGDEFTGKFGKLYQADEMKQ